jgi:hypothetical protein
MKSPANGKGRQGVSDPLERMLDLLEVFDARRPEAERIAGYERFMKATDAAAARYAGRGNRAPKLREYLVKLSAPGLQPILDKRFSTARLVPCSDQHCAAFS